MNWKRIKKENSVQPENGTYSNWKDIIAKECDYQCVYCAIHENNFGGIRNFHVEHFRPKSLEQFKHLINDIKNLYFACPICNTFKGNNWPAEPNDELSNISYPDPSVHNYSDIFNVNTENLVINGNNAASKYVVEKLFLNRPQLILERKSGKVNEAINMFLSDKDWLFENLENINIELSKEYNIKFLELTIKLISLKQKLDKIRLYSTKDIKKKN